MADLVNEHRPDELKSDKRIAIYGLLIAVFVPLVSGLLTYFITVNTNTTNFKIKQYEITFNEKKTLFSKQMDLFYRLEELNENLMIKVEMYDSLQHHPVNTIKDSIN